MSETRVEYKVDDKTGLVRKAIGLVLKEDRLKITYRPSWKKVTGSVNATILLQQVKFRWEHNAHKPFYKFFQPPDSGHPAYREGDSWTEELGFTISELRGALGKVGKRLNKEEVSNLGESLKDCFFGYFTDQQHLTWFYFNEIYFSGQMMSVYSESPNKESSPGKSPNQDSLLGEIRNPDLAESEKLSSIITETTKDNQKGPLDLFFSGTGQTDESVGPDPTDAWLHNHRAEVVRIYDQKSGVWGRTAAERETRRGALLGGLAGREGFNPETWERAIEGSIAHGVGAGNIARFWEVYDCGGDYDVYLKQKYSDDDDRKFGIQEKGGKTVMVID